MGITMKVDIWLILRNLSYLRATASPDCHLYNMLATYKLPGLEDRQCTPSMAELPYDVWLLITSFLTREEVWRLFSVNRILFSIAMDVARGYGIGKYGWTRLGHPE
jgi:hypothetical protein